MTLTPSERVILKEYRQSRKGYHMVGSKALELIIFLRQSFYIYIYNTPLFLDRPLPLAGLIVVKSTIRITNA